MTLKREIVDEAEQSGVIETMNKSIVDALNKQMVDAAKVTARNTDYAAKNSMLNTAYVQAKLIGDVREMERIKRELAEVDRQFCMGS